jgi:hypothetical protein
MRSKAALSTFFLLGVLHSACTDSKSPYKESFPCIDDLHFDVQVTVLTTHANAPTATSSHIDPEDSGTSYNGAQLLQREIEVHLQNNFLSAEGTPVCQGGDCFEFHFKAGRFRNDILDTTCETLLELGDPIDKSYHNKDLEDYIALNDALADAVKACNDERVRDPRAINLYIYNSCAWDETSESVDCDDDTGHGRKNKDGSIYKPYAFIDVSRLQHQLQAPEEHEIGHALGLPHNCDPKIRNASAESNIMQSGCDFAGQSGGRRNLGFGVVNRILADPEAEAPEDRFETMNQVEELVKTAEAIQASWCDVDGS